MDYTEKIKDMGDFGSLMSPDGEPNIHPIAVVVKPVKTSEGDQMVTIDADGVHIGDDKYNTPSHGGRGVNINIVFQSEHEKTTWVRSYTFHKGDTEIRVSEKDQDYECKTIWRD